MLMPKAVTRFRQVLSRLLPNKINPEVPGDCPRFTSATIEAQFRCWVEELSRGPSFFKAVFLVDSIECCALHTVLSYNIACKAIAAHLYSSFPRTHFQSTLNS